MAFTHMAKWLFIRVLHTHGEVYQRKEPIENNGIRNQTRNFRVFFTSNYFVDLLSNLVAFLAHDHQSSLAEL